MTALCFLVMIAVIGMAGCDKKILPADTETVSVQVAVKLQAPGMLQAVDHFQVTVSADDLPTATLSMSYEYGMLVGVVPVTAGPARRFVVEALDLYNIVLYRGETTIDVWPIYIAADSMFVDIDLYPVVPILNLTPHFQMVPMSDSVFVDVHVHGVPHLTMVQFFVYFDMVGPINLVDVVKGASVGDSAGLSFQYYPANSAAITITCTQSRQTTELTDASGNGYLARLRFSTHSDWSGDTATVQFRPAMYELSVSSGPITVGDVYTDYSTVMLYRWFLTAGDSTTASSTTGRR
jgi:hypothetical protein